MIGRLRGRSVTELRDRLMQFSVSFAERHGVGLDTPGMPAEMPLAPRTPWPLPDALAIRARLAPESAVELLARADRIVDGTFDVLGLKGVSYGAPVNWQRDPLSGREAPLRHWSRVPYLDVGQVGDHKITWELNRHQWLIMLGQAWVLTADTRYADTAARLLREWLQGNPPKDGINWCSSLELAFRVQSWIHGLRLFDGAESFTAALRRDLVESAAVQISHVERNLSTWFSPNTHLTGEALAMLCTGAAWPTLPHAARWRRDGWQVLCTEVTRQLRPDGVYFEQSAWYQAYTLDFYVLGVTWARMAGLDVPADLLAHIQRAAVALRLVTRPDGTIARLGDDDGGRTLPLATTPFGDMTDSLWRAADLLGHREAPLPPRTAGLESLLWLEGGEAFDAMARQAQPWHDRQSRALRHGGWVALVEPAAHDTGDHWLVFDAGPHGALTHAHAHADALGFDLSVHGTPIIVDPGTGEYSGDRRTTYRSTASHNTVTVDGSDSSEQESPFRWRSAADAALRGFGAAPSIAAFVTASHDGYRRLADPVRHSRTILRLHRHYWLMFDTLETDGRHDASLTLQLSHGVTVTGTEPRRFLLSAARAAGAVDVAVVLDPRVTARVEHRTISPAYALELPADAIVADAATSGRVTLCTVIGAMDEGAPRELVPVGPAEEAWSVTHAHGQDLVACPGGRPLTLGPVRFDGSALVLLGGTAAHTIVAAGAGTLELAGRAFTLSGDDVRVARRSSEGTWTMES